MDFQFWYTVLLLICLTVGLVKEYISADIMIFGVLILCVVGGVISVDEAFHGFSNAGMLTIAFLFVVATSLHSTGIIYSLIPVLFGKKSHSLSMQLLRFLSPVAVASAFSNNTTIVSTLIPAVKKWAADNQKALSRFLIPLSYATILGGMCTLIGTSTNLVIHGFLIESGHTGFSFFELSLVGAPVAIVGLLYIGFVAHRFLPDRKDPIASLGEHVREFVVELKVDPEFRGIGNSIEDAGLRSLQGLFLFQIEREGANIAPVNPREVIRERDRLFFTGLPSTIMELQKTPGLVTVRDSDFNVRDYDSEEIQPYEVVVSESSPLIGKRVRDSNFRAMYDAVILAIHRSGERINKKIGDIVIRAGDTLLILARNNFAATWYHSRHFYLVTAKDEEMPSKPKSKGILSLVVLLGFIVLATLKIVPIVIAAALAAVGMVLSRCISPSLAKYAIDWSILVVIACSFGIGKAVENSGIAAFLATNLIDVLGGVGIVAILAGLYILTSFYTEIITNNAAAALLFPIALSTAGQLGIDIMPLAIVIAIAASASFATPIGYQTNLMVYGPGGYRFKDYIKAGLPLNLIVGVSTVAIVYFRYF